MDKKGILGLNTTVVFLLGILILAVVAFVLIITVSLMKDTQSITSSSSTTQDYISDFSIPQTLNGDELSSFSATIKNNTWLNCSTDDSITLEVTQSKSTISLWFNNATTDWISIIKAGDNTYVDGVLDNTWTFLPYFISGDDITLCKSDGSTFLDVSIDEFRVYETALNSSDITIVFEEGR